MLIEDGDREHAVLLRAREHGEQQLFGAQFSRGRSFLGGHDLVARDGLEHVRIAPDHRLANLVVQSAVQAQQQRDEDR